MTRFSRFSVIPMLCATLLKYYGVYTAEYGNITANIFQYVIEIHIHSKVSAGLMDGVANPNVNKNDESTVDGTEDRFLKLLVAQMRNQNPMNPMENAEVTSQLAQISTVRGIESLNKSMANFTASAAQNTALASVNMIAHLFVSKQV